jgi:acetate kinase
VNLLILQPTLKNLEYNLFSCDERKLTIDTKVDGFTGMSAEENEWVNSLVQIKQHCQRTQREQQIDKIVLTVLFGGDVFAKPVVVDSYVIQKLENLIPQAPLHLPGTLQLINCCDQVFPEVPIVLVFETSFFCQMPERERIYAIAPGIMKEMNIKRYGYNGICHEAACLMDCRHLRKKSKASSARIISICLESQPEVAAVKGRRVLMVTKAIPGKTMCGQIDPNIVLTLSETVGWGPEKINAVLTKKSGLLGLTGENITLEDVFTQDNPDFLLARQICQYRLLNTCGAAIAAMGGVDAIVFSGRFVKLAAILEPYLIEKLALTLMPEANHICFYSFKESRAVSIVNAAATTISHSN